jgi:hypothetical protein
MRQTFRWAFDDRTESTDQNPEHTFRKPGWYAVTMDARDDAGHTYRVNLLVHAWRERDWVRMQQSQDMRIVRRSIRELQRKNAEVAASRTAAAAATTSSSAPAAGPP